MHVRQIDALGRLTAVTEDPSGLNYLTSYTNDPLDNLVSVSQNGSRMRVFSFDSLSRLTSSMNPESGTLTYIYNANGNVSSRKDARNIAAWLRPLFRKDWVVYAKLCWFSLKWRGGALR